MAFQIGIKPHELGRMTLSELKLCVEAEEERYRRQLHVAYMTAYWSRVTKLQPFDQYFKKTSSAMTDEEMLETARFLNDMFGGK